MLQYCVVIAVLALISIPYLWYPLWQMAFPGKPKEYGAPKEWPSVSVVFAAYNEISIIEEKIRSIYSTNYPAGKLEVLVGSDLSNDGTDDAIRQLQSQFPALTLHVNAERSGKSATINRLVDMAKGSIIVATDANIIFKPDTLEQLVAPLIDPAVGGVAGELTYVGSTRSGTASHENTYLSVENRIRIAESNKYGFCLGMEGGLYAIKAALWTPIPPKTFMEDFFETMKLIDGGHKIVYQPMAIGLEDVSTEMSEEFKRKIRISTGNWQNLARFAPMLWKHSVSLTAAFLFHKILRWCTPLLYILATAAALAMPNTRSLGVILLCVPLALAVIARIRPKTPSKVVYFYSMNVAMLVGLIKYLKGVRTNVWQPTKRNQA